MTNQEIRMKELIEKLNDPNTLDRNDTLYNELVLLQSLTGVVLPNSPIKKSESGENVEKVIDVIKQLQATSGRKDKENILESNKTNELLKRVLHFVYNPYIVTGLSSKKINKDLPKIDEKPLDFVDLLDYFAKNCTGRDLDIQIAQNFLNSVEKNVDFYKEVLTKDLKIGCTSKTLNKIYGDDFIEEFNVMLAQKYSDNAEKVEGKQYTITEKRDGCFIGKSKIMTLEGLKSIKDVRVGDFVQSFNEKTKEVSFKKVLNVFKNGQKDNWLKIKSYETNLDKKLSNQVTTTPNHKFFTKDGWKRADELKVGDKVYTYDYKIPNEIFYRYKKEEVEAFRDWLEIKYGIKSKVVFGRKEIKTEGDGYILSISSESSYDFFELIAKYIPIEIRDKKLPVAFHEVEEIKWWENKICYGLVESTIYSIEKENKTHNSYDLEVEENHTYIVENFAVHNCRSLFIKENGIIKAFTRQGQVYEGLVDLERGLGELEIDNVAIDGELMVLNDHEIDAAEQFKATMKIVRKDGEKHGVKLVVFDYMPLEDFKKGVCKTPYSQRRLNLEKDFKDTKFFEPVKKLYQGKDISMISKLLDEVTSKGGEGLMVNIDDAPYECKRTDKLLKVKKMLTCDVLVLDVYEGTGRNVGKLGGITIQFKNQKDELCKCNCGSGFTDEERDRYWKNKDLLIGKIVELDYFDITQDSKTKEYGLRFPIWKSIIRHDKTEISMY